MLPYMRLTRKRFPVGAIILTLLSLLAPLFSQTGNGIVKGTVTDASSAVVPNASVTVTNQDTNVARRGTSSTDGGYYFGQLPPGPYVLLVEHQGFEKWSGALTVQVGQTVAVDPKLTVGAVTNTVSVGDVAPVITTEGMQVADVKDGLRIQQLPLNGRQISNLFNLTAGVEGGGAARVNGLKVGSMEIVQDGISLVDRFSGGIVRVQPGLDTVQEFRIETSSSSARYPRPATVTLVTKSGTNQLHGSLFETFRNNAAELRARTRQDGNTPAKLIRNEFGVSAGGPVVFPKLYDGHNKTFWFFAYEGLRQREATFDEDYVPTPAMFRGDFSNISDNNGVQTHIYDPVTTNAQGVRQQFPGDIIPQNRLNPFFKVMQSITHAPTSAVNPFQGPNLDVFYPLKTDTSSYTAKGDHRFSDKDNLSVRLTRSLFNRAQVGGRYGSPVETLTDGFGTGLNATTVFTGTITETHVFAPNFLNEFLIAANRNPNHQGTLADSTNWSQKLGLPNPFGVTGWPTISAGSFPGNNWDADNAKDQNLTAYHAEDNLTLVKGKHTMSFGGRARREYSNVRELQQAQGSHNFGDAWTAQYDPSSDQALPFTGIGVASMALGLPTFLSNQYNRGYFYFRQSEFGLYYHDSWKVSPRLTLEFGLRWDKWTPYKEKYNRLDNVDITKFATQFQVVSPYNTTLESIPGLPPSVLASWAKRGLTWTTAEKAGLPGSLIPSPNNDFGPRVGAAYRLNDKTSIRAGYGEYFWTLPLSQILQTSRINPPLNLRYTNPLGSLDGTSTFGVRTAPQANYYVGKAQVDVNGVIQIPATSAQTIFPYDYRDWKDTKAREWQFTIERELIRNTALRLSYIGDRGSNLEQRYALNNQEAQYNYEIRTGNAPPANRDFTRVNPNWSFGNGVLAKNGYSNTNSFQAQVERRYSSGLAFQAFYTYTHSLTTSDAGGASSGNGSINDTSGSPVVPENIQLLDAPNNTYDQRRRLVYYNSTAIPPHRVVWNGIYDLPFGRGKQFGKNVSRFVDAFIGGWQIATIGNFRSGTWLSVSGSSYLFGNPILSGDQRLTLKFNGRNQRLYFAGDFDPRLASNVDQTKLQALIPVDRSARKLHPLGAAFDNRLPVTLTNGTVRLTPITDTVNWNSRAFILGPTNWNADGSVFKNFSITEAVKLRVTADFFNVFNHPNDVNPNGGTGLQDLSQQANDPRIIQFSMRLSF